MIHQIICRMPNNKEEKELGINGYRPFSPEAQERFIIKKIEELKQ